MVVLQRIFVFSVLLFTFMTEVQAMVKLLGEVNVADNGAGPGIRSMAAYSEMDLLISQGWRLFMKWDVYAPDIASQQKSGKLERLVVGDEFFPSPFIELRPQVHFDHYRINNNLTINVLLQLHTYL